MTDFRTIFGEYLKAADLGGVARVVTIERATPDSIKDQNGKEKPQVLLKLVNQKKEFGCNITNCNTIAEMFGTYEIERWVGQRIVLYPTMVSFGSKMVEAIRVRSIEQEKAIRANYQGPPRPGGGAPTQQAQQPGPRPVAQMLPPAHDPNYVQTTLNDPRADDLRDFEDDAPPLGNDSFGDDDIPF